MVDMEREMYEGLHGKQTPGQFLNLLLEDEDMAWLRRFSMLIVEIDEMFDLKDGVTPDLIDAHIQKVRELVAMSEADDYFKDKYQYSLQHDANAAGLHSQLKTLLGKASV